MPLRKKIFREDCFRKIKKVPKLSRFYRNAKINAGIQKELKNIKNKRVLVYNSLEFEADITKTIKKLRKKCDIFVPFMQGESFKMVPFRLPLKKNRFGIYEAGKSLKNIYKIDIAIVPIVGIDGNLQRVGFGKGMYDRFFAKLKKRPYTIFVQTKLCYTKEIICDDYDIACDVLITPCIKVKNRGYGYIRTGKRC